MKKKTFLQPLLTALALGWGVKMFICGRTQKRQAKVASQPKITFEEVEEIQNQWGLSLVRIGMEYTRGGDYKSFARAHIDRFYNYERGIVLFKPTMASVKQFRTDKESALSYFIGDCKNCPEDHGFALRPWKSVRWENAGTIIEENVALAMGNYYFNPADGSAEVKVEYSFAFSKDTCGNLRIIMHDSHIPYQPNH